MKHILTICLSLFSLSLTAQTAEGLFTKMLETMKAHQSLSYSADLRIVYAGAMDTSRTKALVHLLRDSRDTVWGGMIWIGEDGKRETYSFYDLERTYIVMSQIKRARKEHPQKGNPGLSLAYRSTLLYPFLQPAMMQQSAASYKWSLLPETNIAGRAAYAVQLEGRRPWDGQLSTQIYYLDKNTYFPLAIAERTPYSNNTFQHSLLLLSGYEFDKASKAQFAASQIPADFTIDVREKQVPKIDPQQVRPAAEWPLPGTRRR